MFHYSTIFNIVLDSFYIILVEMERRNIYFDLSNNSIYPSYTYCQKGNAHDFLTCLQKIYLLVS